MKSRKTRKASKPQSVESIGKPLSVQNYSWGCIYAGTQKQLIESGLLTQADFRHAKNCKQFYVNGADDETREANFGDHDIRVDGRYDVFVRYSVKDNDVNPRINACLQQMSAIYEMMVRAVERIRPVPLSDKMRIPAVEVQDITDR